jgi:Ca2+/Na+ antiporter
MNINYVQRHLVATLNPANDSLCVAGSCDFLDNMCLDKLDIVPGSIQPDCPGNTFGIVFEIFLFLYAMLGLAIVCDDYLCVALERLCDVYNIREDVAGATFMAFGSAAPEIIVNAVSTIKQAKAKPGDASAIDATNTGVGAILGSGMIAFLVIPGACALSTDEGIQLQLKRRPLLRDVGAYATALLLLCVFFHDGRIKLYESGILVSFYLFYVMVVVFAPTVRREYRHRILKKPKKKRKSFVKKKATANASVADSNIMDQPLLNNPEDGEANNETSFSITPGHDEDKKSTKPRVKFGDENDGPIDVTILGAAESNEKLSLNDSGNDEDEPSGPIGKFISIVAKPLTTVFEWTCFPCEEGSKYENYYPITFIISFVYVSFFSFIIGTCVQRWVLFTPDWMKGSFFGLITIAIGAEIPDTIQSVTMAKRGYGSMAVSNALGSQIINILIGLGLPWLLVDSFGGREGGVCVTDHVSLQSAASFQFCAVAMNFILLLGVAVYKRTNKAHLTKLKGKIFLCAYAVVLLTYCISVAFGTRSTKSPCDID